MPDKNVAEEISAAGGSPHIATIPDLFIVDAFDDVKPEIRVRPMGEKRMMEHEALLDAVRMTGASIRTISSGLTESHYLYKAPSARFNDAVDSLEDEKLLHTLREGADTYNFVVNEYM